FDDWDNLVRGALIWLEQDDPVDTQDRSGGGDEEREMINDILTHLYTKYCNFGVEPPKPFTVKRLHEEEDVCTRELFASYLRGGKWDRAKVGRLLSRMADRPCNGIVLRKRQDTTLHVREYVVSLVGE
ncbi:unnamed protein product, partial [marine sediment metagenome]